jgi:Tn3 transposase DDE domain
LRKNPNIVMAWMTQNIQRVLDAWHHAGTRRVEGDQLRHMAPVHVQGINLRGVLQLPVARYRNRLILETPSRARQRANATTGRHTSRRKPLMLMSHLT